MRHKLSVSIIFFIVFALLGMRFWYQHRRTPQKPTPQLQHQAAADPFLTLLGSMPDQTAAGLGKMENAELAFVKNHGVSATMDVLRNEFEQGKIDMNSCHRLTHIIGHYAYQPFVKDIASLVRTDQNLCGDGYEHGLEAQITLQSSDPIKELHEYCQAMQRMQPGISCYHGVGHAQMHSTLNVNSSLVTCDSLVAGSPVPDVTDCYKGVFSEYAAQLEGVDGDTGIPFPEGPYLKANFAFPLDYCQKLPPQYRDACASQLSRIALDYEGAAASLGHCAEKKYDLPLQAQCIQIISAILWQRQFTNDGSFIAVGLNASWVAPLHYAYIDGMTGEYWAQVTSGKSMDFQGICNSFNLSSDRSYCLSKIHPA